MSENEQVPTGWYPDPAGRHELRYWAQGRWQASVSDANRVSGDPIGTATFPPPALGVTAGAGAPPAAAATSAGSTTPAPAAAPPAAAPPAAAPPAAAPPAAATPAAPPAPSAAPAFAGAPAAPDAPPAFAGAPAAPDLPPATSPLAAAAPGPSAAPAFAAPPAAPAEAPPTVADHADPAPGPAPTEALAPPVAPSVFAAPPEGPIAVPPAGSPTAVGLAPAAAGRPSIPAPGATGRRLRTGAPGAVATAAFLMAVQAAANTLLAIALLAVADFANDFGGSVNGEEGAGNDLQAYGVAVGVLAVLLIATAIGLSMTARWSKVMAVVISVAEIGLAVALAASAGEPDSLTGAVLPVVIIILVFTPGANRAFQRGYVDESAVMA